MSEFSSPEYILFFNSLYFTLFACVVVILMLFMSIRSRKNQRTQYSVISGFFLLGFITTRFLQTISYSTELEQRFSSLTFLWIVCILFIQLIYYAKTNYPLIIFSAVLVIVSAVSYDQTIREYFHVQSLLVNGIRMYFIVTLFILCTWDTYVVIHTNKKNPINTIGVLERLDKYKVYEVMCINGGLIIVLLCLLVGVLIPSDFPIEDLGLISYMCLVVVTFLFFMPQVKIPFGYSQILSNMLDTVVVIDEKNTLLYVNDSKCKTFFNFEQSVDFDSIIQSVNGSKCREIHFGADQKQLNFYSINGEQKALMIFRKVILRDNKIIGYIITINDCSHLETMIVEKEIQKNDLDLLKYELTKYSQTSKNLLAEKQRNRLLIEVQNELGHYLVELAKHITQVLQLVEDEEITASEKQPRVHESIETGIMMAKANLTKIRETVIKYRSSYNIKKEQEDDKSTFSG